MNRMLKIYLRIKGTKMNNINAPNQVLFFYGDINQMSKILPLIELQDVDTQLRDINELLGDLPKKVDKLRDEEEGLINNVKEGKDRLKEIELSLNKAEHQMTDLKGKIDKLKDQLSLVTTNKQYDALTQEIEYLKQELDEAELKDLEFEEEKDI